MEARPTKTQATIAGAIAAAVALGTATLVSGVVAPGPSLVASVSTWFIDTFAGPLKETAVALFGENDKAALLIGIVVISLAIGAGLGRAARTRPAIALVGFAAFGAVGVIAGIGDNLASNGSAVISALLAVAAGLVTLFGLFSIAATGSAVARFTDAMTGQLVRSSGAGDTEQQPDQADTPGVQAPAPIVTEWPTDPRATRRSFLAWGTSASAFAAVAAAGGKSLSNRGVALAARNEITLPRATGGSAGSIPASQNNPFGIEGLTPYIKSNEDFYLIDTAPFKPKVDPNNWQLDVTGMVDEPFSLSFDELQALPLVEEAVTLSCVSNEVGGRYVGNAVWLGYPLADLLDRAGVQDGATQIVGTSTDGWTAGFPTEAAFDGRTAMVAIGMNGEPLPIAHGFPARLVVSGLYGYVSATKWLTEISLTTWEDFDGYWINRGWSKEGPVKTQSRIDVPQRSSDLVPGPTPIAGVAWAPNIGIDKVEVQVDDGPWMPATLADVTSDDTWRQWMVEWDATPGSHTLRSRATDASGYTQTPELAPPEPSGATGHHTRQVVVSG